MDGGGREERETVYSRPSVLPWCWADISDDMAAWFSLLNHERIKAKRGGSLMLQSAAE